jgi:hypothetical protein
VNNVVLGMSGKLANDLVSVSGTGTFTQKNVGNNLSYAVTDLRLTSADAGNYYIGGGINQLSGTNGVITPASLVLSTENVLKIYDGNVNAPGILKAVQGTQLFGTDTMRGGTFTFTSPTVGINNKVVRVSDAIINDGNDGNEGRNYSVSYVDNTQSSIILPSAPFVLTPFDTTDAALTGKRSKGPQILYEITMERNFIVPSQENSEICKPLLSVDCFCISPENRDFLDGVNCGKDPKSVQIKYTKIPRI